MTPEQIFIAVAGSILLLIAVGLVAFVARLYQKVNQGQALVINTHKGTEVSFTGALVIPVIHRAEIMDISVKTIEISREEHDGLICKDNIRADIRVTFFVRVNELASDVKRVAKMIGCERASNQDTVEELFVAKFSEALKTAGKKFNFEELYQSRQAFRDSILEVIGDDLNGYTLEDVAIDYLEQTPMNKLDIKNMLDAEGIRKITERTEEQRVRTTELSNSALKRISKDNLETRMAVLEHERQQADAEAKQKREIETVRATQHAEAEEVKARELARERKAQLAAQQQIEVTSINKEREEEIAKKARERAIVLEQEAIEKEKQLTITEREREVSVRRIQRDSEIEREQKLIAEVRRDRIALEKTVAQEEENIKDLRLIAEAERQKKATIIRAEAEAQQKLVVDIKAAEASEEVAKFQARQRLVEADATLDAADRTAKAKIREAEGVQAEHSAKGLAAVRVADAEAAVLEKRGNVEARVLREKMAAEADGTRTKGMAEAEVDEAKAAVLEKRGTVEAKVLREKLQAEADGSRQKGMADAEVKEALAVAVEKHGLAEAKVLLEKLEAEATGVEKKELAHAAGIRERLVAEADGLSEKAEAMKKLDDYSREHEEFRLTLEHQRALETERLRTNVDMGRAQAEVLAEAFKAANINIVGGEEGFYNNFIKSVSLGHTVEGFLDSSGTTRALVDKVLGRLDRSSPSPEDAEDAPSDEALHAEVMSGDAAEDAEVEAST
jgi:uncharacterized membrane protein YqiK